ncbi:glucosaminidase domain-containing protein [Alteromonas sp. CYL-A6]|uniref:glucosaminidase domain-containing protein n=1 Tax=Alteromonas nitratireducens TaxID=3390813 RepID=UPI0034C0AB93
MKTMTSKLIAMLVVLSVALVIYVAFFSRVTPPDFSQYPAGPERKAAFFSYFAPIVTDLNQEIQSDRTEIQSTCSTERNADDALKAFEEKYRIDEKDLQGTSLCEVLLRRADIIPASLALAQAANESAWGTSRFAQQGNNFFGQWCFKKGCGIVPNDRNDGAVHEVADFRSPSDSVKSYMMNLNAHDAYRELRQIRASLRNKNAEITGLPLTRGLNSYSERGAEYGKELRNMIEYNDLTRYDTAQ